MQHPKKAGTFTIDSGSVSSFGVGDIVGIDMGNGAEHTVITKMTQLGDQTEIEIIGHTIKNKPHPLVAAVNKATQKEDLDVK